MLGALNNTSACLEIITACTELCKLDIKHDQGNFKINSYLSITK